MQIIGIHNKTQVGGDLKAINKLRTVAYRYIFL